MKTSGCITICLLLTLLMPLLPVYNVSATSTTVSLDPTNSYATVGGTLNVNLKVANVVNLAVWEFRLFYLSSVLNCTGAVKGPFLESGGSSQFFTFTIYGSYNATHGCLLFGSSLLGQVPGVNGSGTLATITFQAIGAGNTSLHFDNDPVWNFLQDSSPPPRQSIPYTANDGTAQVQNFTLTVSVSPVGSGSVSLNNTGPYYYYGEALTLTVTPITGWSFSSWTGDLSGSANPATLIITSNMSVTAYFTQISYTLIPYTVGSGSVSLNNTGPYHYGDAVQLTAVPTIRWIFQYWTGNLSGSANPATLIMTSNMVVTAYFSQINYTLTVSTLGQGSVNLNNTGPTYHYNDVVRLTAVPANGSIFSSWTGDLSGSANPAVLVITGNMTVTATFTVLTFILTVNTVGYGNVNLNNTGPYHYNDVVRLTAVPANGSIFSSWSGNLSGSANPATLIMTSNMVVTAYFSPINYTLTISTFGSGSVTLNNTGPYHYGDAVQLTAVPTIRWIFKYWTGNLSGSANPAVLVITGNMAVNANFTYLTYILTVNTVGQGSVNLNNTGPYYYNDVVRLNATPVGGWSFSSWTGDLSSSANPAVLVITGNMTVTATFTQNNYTLSVSTVGDGSVSVSLGKVQYGDNVVLTAYAANGWVFHYWSGDLTGSDNPATLIITDNFSVTANFILKPGLQISPATKTFRVYGENFTVAINISNAVNVDDFDFEIDYNTTLLNYVGVTWTAWGSGTVNVDEYNGVITGFTSGAALNGNQTLMTIMFQAHYYHVWKSAPGWTNDLSGIIFFQTSNVSYLTGPDLHYGRGDTHEIDVGPDFVYTFSPIQGDVDNNGVVNIFDLRTVAAYFDVHPGDPFWQYASTYDLNGDDAINVLDLRIVASNYGYTYMP